MRPRVLLTVAAGVAVAIVAYAVVTPSGLFRLRALDEQERTLTDAVKKARTENARLADEVRVLQGNDPASKAVLEKRAREELGYVKADEVVLTGLPTLAVPAGNPAQ